MDNLTLKEALPRLRSNDATLTMLDLRYNKIDKEGAIALADALKENTTLTTLNLRLTQIGNEGVVALAEALKENTTLTMLDLGSNEIGKEGAIALAEALKENTTLTTLDLGSNEIGKEGAIALAEALKENTTLTQLELGWNKIGKEGAIALAEALKEKKNTTLTTLGLELNEIDKEGAIALAEALKEKKNTTLTALNLGRNIIGKEGAIALAEALKKNATLTTLNLRLTLIGKEGAIALAEALKENTTLTTLELLNNQIGKEGAIALAEALKKNTTLTTLNLVYNEIGNKGAIALAEALKENTTLTTLELGYNQIGNEGVVALAEALKENTTLTELDLKGNAIRREGATALAEALKKNTSLTTLDLGSNKIGKEGAIALAEALKENTNKTLTTLDLGFNEIGKEGAIALAEALKENTTLTTLNLGGNEIGKEGAIALAEALKENTTLTTLELENNEIGDEGAQVKSNILDIISRSRVFHRHKDDIEVDGFSFYLAINEETGKLYIKESVWEAAATTDGLVLGLVHNVIRDHLDACNEDDLQSTKDELKTLLITSRNSDESPLLHLAAARTSAKALALAQYLVKEIGVDLDHAVTDKEGRTARDIAMAGNSETRNWAKSVGTFLGRYRIEEEGRYSSGTCTVDFATDVTKSKSDPARNVAIKSMHNREQFDRELKQRLGDSRPYTSNGFDLYTKDDSGDMIENGKGLNRFDVDHVVPLLRYHIIEDFEGKRYHCLIMLKGERNLDDIFRYEGIAGKDVNKITSFAVDLAKALNHLHSDHNLIHADVKPRNVVRIRGDNKLIDFDASVNIGERLTEKFSSGYLPPEVAAVRFQLEESLDDLMRRKEELKQKFKDERGDDDEDKILKELTELNEKIEQVKSVGSNSDKEEPVGDAQVDIWAYGVLMFELLTGRPLFNCDKIFDNLSNDKEERRLVNWKDITDEDLSDVLKECPDQGLTESAKDLLRKCLCTKQSRLKTFNQVLQQPFLNQKELQLQKLDKGLENIDTKLDQANEKLDQANKKLDQTHKMLSEMQTELAHVSRGVNNILKGCHAPKLMYIIPEDPSVMDWINLNALVGEKVKVIFICPVTLYIPRDGNNKPMGYSMEMPRNWVRKYGPALKISYEILRIGFAVGRLANLPLPNLSSVGSSTNIMNVLNDNLLDYMKEAPDLKELADVLGDRVTLALPEADENLSKHEDMRTKINASYEEVKNIAKRNGDEDFLQTGLSKVVCDGHVEYVLDKAEIKSIYQQMGPSCLGLPQAELQARGADLGVVMKEGYLDKETAFGWKERYVILRKGGFLTHYESKEEWLGDLLGVMGKPKPKIVAVNRTGKSFKLTYEGEKCQSFKPTKSAVETNAEIQNWVEKAGAAGAHL